ncbi:MAG: SMC family ATPase, partial [Candidatus Lokiarchaeota archaeon]
MIINSLKLKNFISHGNNTVEFPLGVSILVGPNGAGKSAVIDAILYALTGDRVRGDVIDDLIRERTDKMEVSLDFQLDGLNYKIHRNRVRGGAPNAKFRIDDKLIANSHTEVTNEILRLLQMDKDTIVNSIFIRQGEITQLIDADPSERKAIIGKLIGLDKVEKAYVNMKKLVNHFKEKVKNFDKVSTEIKIREERRLRVEKLIEGIEKE